MNTRYTKQDLEKLVSSGRIRGVLGEKKPKFFNKKTYAADGYQFDSKKESIRYLDLKAMQEAGTITDLRRQQEFDLIVNDQLVCSYVSDFTYLRDGKLIIEDVKSKHTRKLPVYSIKRKLMLAVLGITIVEI